MKKLVTAIAVLATGLMSVAHADPAKDLKQFQEFFKKKFPTVPFDEYANGFYALPSNKAYREQWKEANDFPAYELGLGKGKVLWEKPFKNGKTFASCFKDGGKNIAHTYPKWDEESKQIRTAEKDINTCLKKNGEPEFGDLDKDDKARLKLAELTAYFYSLSKGQRIKVDLSNPKMLEAYEKGKQSWWARRGQLNFACANCHMDLAGRNIGGNQPLSAALGHTTAWPAQRLEWGRIETLHFRYMTCNSQVRAKPFKHSGDEYTNLQVYETFNSSGLPLTAPAMRN